MSFHEEKEQEIDFSKPLPLSDAILVVEEHRFHVHRATLAMWSPVFQQMFTSEFKEKTAEEIPLPEKEASEIKEMLLVIYPTSAKPIDEDNCHFLLALAREYQIKKLTAKCEDFMLESLKRERGCSVLNELILSESFNLERLREECIGKTHDLSYKELKKHELYERVAPLSQLRITEGQMEKLEKKLDAAEKEASMWQSQVKTMANQAAKGLQHANSIASSLAGHIRVGNELKTGGIVFTEEQNMEAIKNDHDPQPPFYSTGFGGSLYTSTVPGSRATTRPGKEVKCKYLEGVYSPLKEIHGTLENIQKSQA